MEVKDIIKEELKKSLENLESAGLNIGEEVLWQVFKELDATVKRVVARTENNIDDLYSLVSGPLSEAVDEAIDKIDGEDDPARN